MGESTNISWCTSTFSPWWGCQNVSPACDKCYASAFSERVGHGKRLPVIWGGASTERRFFGAAHWAEPFKWNRKASRSRKVWRVFSGPMCDVFEGRADLLPYRAQLWRLTLETPSLTWLLLTKRPHLADAAWRLAAMDDIPAWLPNVHLGTTVEDRKFGVPRLAALRAVPARSRFLSCEPLLEDLGDIDLTGIAQVIVGGESGGHPRPFNFAWARRIRDQCREQNVAFFCKQLGANPVGDWGPNPPTVRVDDLVNDTSYLRLSRRSNGTWLLRDLRHGANIGEFPDDLRIREFAPVDRLPSQ